MGLNEILNVATPAAWIGGTVLVVLFTLIQISPIRLNPWDHVFGWIGSKVNSAIQKRLKDVEKQVQDMWVNNHRQTILVFARECREDIAHSSDEWTNVLNVAEEYEKYVTENKVTNGIITQDTEYLRNLYQQLSRDRRI